MLESLSGLRKAGTLGALDAAFGEWIARWGGEPVALAGALASAQVAQSRVCLELAAAGETLRAHGLSVPLRWKAALAESPAVAAPGARAPLVLHGERVYLHRYWCYETRIAAALRELAAPIGNFDARRLQAALHEFFSAAAGEAADRQALGALLGMTRGLAIISGGPGTGKTTTVGKLIGAARAVEPNLSVALAAPTGKAAARLREVFDDPAEVLPGEPQTLHRLLGYNTSAQRIRYHRDNPLAADLVVVDEASMVDIGLMARLLVALKPGARLVLVGDRNQLASVEAGAVFGDICSVAAGFPPADAESLEALLGAPLPRAAEQVSPVSASIALLKENHRFKGEGLGELADAVVAGNAEKALGLLGSSVKPSSTRLANEPDAASLAGEAGGPSPLLWRSLVSERQLARELDRVVAMYCKPILEADDVEAALAALARFRLLAAERRGPFGVEGLNARVERRLGVRADDPWYRGRPVLVTENDYELEVFNGDFGVVWPDEAGRTRLWLAAQGGPRRLSPARLPAHETAWALTVHKSQGSEFERVALVLAPRKSAVATRELVYTAITRAREGVEVWATEPVLRHAIETPIRRASALAARLR